jgi:hypothetical protein
MAKGLMAKENPKAEIRNPKEGRRKESRNPKAEGRKKAEIRSPKWPERAVRGKHA